MKRHSSKGETKILVDTVSLMVKLCAVMTDINTILETLGGEAAVAKSLGCGVSAISNWKVRGIPAGRKYDLLTLAKRNDIPLSIDDLEAADRAIGGAS